MALSSSRSRKWKPTPEQPPDNLVDKYTRLYEAALRHHLFHYAQHALYFKRRGDDSKSPIVRDMDSLTVHFADEIFKSLSGPAAAMVDDVSAQNLGSINKLWKQVVGVPFTDDKASAEALAKHREENVALIKGLAADAMARVRQALDETQGEDQLAVQTALHEAIGVGGARARLIARDQTLKINGNLTKVRHKAGGITKYEWVTSHDERVRPSHRALNGQEFDWDHPPVVDPKRGRHEHPGGDYQCRCIANPIIDLDAIGASSTTSPKVYAPVPATMALPATKQSKKGAKKPKVAPAPVPAVAAPPLPVLVPPPPPAPEPVPLPPHVPAAPAALPSWWHKPTGDLTDAEFEEFSKLGKAERRAHAYQQVGKPIPDEVLEQLKAEGSTLHAAIAAPKAAPVVHVVPTVAVPLHEPVKQQGEKIVFTGWKRPLPSYAEKIAKRNPALAPKPGAYANFASIPINEKLDGILFDDHANGQIQYPDNLSGNADLRTQLLKATDDAMRGMPSSHIDSLKAYTGAGYVRMNELLRDGEEKFVKRYGEHGLSDLKTQIHDCKMAMAKLPLAPDGLVLFRGYSLEKGTKEEIDAELDRLAQMEVFTANSFLSTTRNPSTSMAFMGRGEENGKPAAILLRIHRAHTGVCVDHVSTNESEQEVLFQPGTKFRVTGRQRVGPRWLVVDLEEIR